MEILMMCKISKYVFISISLFVSVSANCDTNRNEVHLKLSGVVPPVYTPFNDDGSINFTVIPHYMDFLANRNISGILVGGTSGEGVSLTVEERKRVAEAWVEAASPYALHVMVQVGGGPLKSVLELAKHAQEICADSILTLPELYFRPSTAEDLVDYVAAVAAAVPHLPVLYYHIPASTNVHIKMPAFVQAATARISNFKGLKFTSNDLSEAQDVLAVLKPGQKSFLGADPLLASAAVVGYDSIIGSAQSFLSTLSAGILDAVSHGDVATAATLQRQVTQCISILLEEGGPGSKVAAMKAGMEMLTGIQVGPPRLPLKPLSKAQRDRAANRLKAKGLMCQDLGTSR